MQGINRASWRRMNLQFFGGRGASSGFSDKGKKYGSQFHSILDTNGKPLVSGNIKFIESNSRRLNTNEKKMLEKVKRVWYDYLGRR